MFSCDRIDLPYFSVGPSIAPGHVRVRVRACACARSVVRRWAEKQFTPPPLRLGGAARSWNSTRPREDLQRRERTDQADRADPSHDPYPFRP